jgi:hypothetical protein
MTPIRISYSSGFKTYTSTDFYKGTTQASGTNVNPIETIKFKFYCTKLRLISRAITSRSNSISIKIDSDVYYFSERYNGINSCLVFNIIGLYNGVHIIAIGAVSLDAIDIDSTGYLLHPVLIQKTTVDSMAIVDCIPCRYTATTANVAGYFSELGTCTADEIPIMGTSTPSGLFYFIKNEKGVLIADRVIQTGVSWDVLNNMG